MITHDGVWQKCGLRLETRWTQFVSTSDYILKSSTAETQATETKGHTFTVYVQSQTNSCTINNNSKTTPTRGADSASWKMNQHCSSTTFVPPLCHTKTQSHAPIEQQMQILDLSCVTDQFEKKKNTLRWQNEGTSLNKVVLHCCTRSFSWQRLSSHIFLLKKVNLLCIRSRNQDDRGKCVSDFPALMLGYFILGPDFFFFTAAVTFLY